MYYYYGVLHLIVTASFVQAPSRLDAEQNFMLFLAWSDYVNGDSKVSKNSPVIDCRLYIHTCEIFLRYNYINYS